MPACKGCNAAKADKILWLEWEPEDGCGPVWDRYVYVWPVDYGYIHLT